MARLSPTAYARRKGVSHQHVFRLIKQGRLRRGRDGKLDEQKADAAIRDTAEPARADRKKDAPADNGKGTYAAYAKSRAEEKEYSARLKRLQYLAKRGDFVRADVVRDHAFTIGRLVQQLLLALPERLAMIFESTDRERIERVKQELRNVLKAMADEIARRHGKR